MGLISLHCCTNYLRSRVPKEALTSLCACVINFNIKMLNIGSRKPPTPLEQFLLDYVWANPDSTAETCREGLSRKLKDSTIRTILRKLEEKGYVTHKVDGRTFIYRAADSRRSVAVEAVRHVIERFCDGSVEELLVGLVDNQVLQPKQLQRLAEKIASRKEKKV